MNKFLIKGFAGAFLVSSACSVSNYCSALREFPDWCYGEGEVTEEGKIWFVNEVNTRFKRLTEACISLGKDFNEKNKAETEKSFGSAFRLVHIVERSLGGSPEGIFGKDKAGLIKNAFYKFNKAFYCLPPEANMFVLGLMLRDMGGISTAFG